MRDIDLDSLYRLFKRNNPVSPTKYSLLISSIVQKWPNHLYRRVYNVESKTNKNIDVTFAIPQIHPYENGQFEN